ncbi:TPA: T9SS type A sorting domain-containing protein [Candidatus Poribacteria bacterium]|nr:T9SS type A sorting domain-containing protein [Candidatus Poribacteria bacterium]
MKNWIRFIILLIPFGLMIVAFVPFLEAEIGYALTDPFTFDTRLTPTIEFVSPSEGTFFGGGEITILGSNFVVGQTAVKLGENYGLDIVVKSDTEITLRTPGSLQASVDVVVINPGEMIVVLEDGFQYVEPTVTDVRLTINPKSLVANGTNTATITIQLFDQDNQSITDELVKLSVSLGTIDSPVFNREEKVYRAQFTSPLVIGDAIISAETGNGKIVTSKITLIKRKVSTSKSTVSVEPSTNIAADGKSTATINVTLLDDRELPLSGRKVVIRPDSKVKVTIPSLTDNEGKAVAKVSSIHPQTVVLTTFVGGLPLLSKPVVHFTLDGVKTAKVSNQVIILALDVNKDSEIDVLDLVQVASMFGQVTQGLMEDVNRDGVVDIFDLMQVALNLGQNVFAAPPVLDQQFGIVANLNQSAICSSIIALKQLADTRTVYAVEILETLLVPQQIQLRQNYPNPFNPETWIPYDLAVDANVSVEIYDITGHVIKRINLGYQSAGSYRDRSKALFWNGLSENGERVANGIYYIKFTAGEVIQICQLAIIK